MKLEGFVKLYNSQIDDIEIIFNRRSLNIIIIIFFPIIYVHHKIAGAFFARARKTYLHYNNTS